jgi:hypothetical protein
MLRIRIFSFCKEFDLDLESFKMIFNQKPLIDNVFESGLRSGVNRTPSFLLMRKYEGDWTDTIYFNT